MCRCCCDEHPGHGHYEAYRSHHRRYFSKQEIAADLKQYKETLQKELAGVTERIAELEK